MPLFTSSSNAFTRVSKSFFGIAAGAIILFFISLFSYEAFLKSQGISTYTLTDDMALWSIQREKIDKAKDTSDMVVLLGDSRMQLGFSSDAFKEMYPERELVRLAVKGGGQVASLIDIAENTDFKGTVIIGIFIPMLRPNLTRNQQAYVDYYHQNWGLDEKLDRIVKSFLEQHLLSMNPLYRVKAMTATYKKDEPLRDFYLKIAPDRDHSADYARQYTGGMAEMHAKRQDRMERMSERPHRKDEQMSWIKGAMEVETYVRKIVGRGGKVVFVRFPTGQAFYKAANGRIFPRELFWDVYANRSQARFVHFMDYPELNFDSPDGSHLDVSDKKAFTENLLHILKQKDVLD